MLEQNDATRTLYWKEGNLRYLHSDSVGEQFGNYLIRLGILDLAALRELLSDGEGSRVGDRVVSWGLMTAGERNSRLHELLANILIHALEHTVISMRWKPGGLGGSLSGDLQFQLDHRVLIWEVFQRIHNLHELRDNLRAGPAWRWKAREDLLFRISDLPLNPEIAYALSRLGTEPLSYPTLMAITGLEEKEAARIIVALWALGGLTLVQGEMPLVPESSKEDPAPAAAAPPPMPGRRADADPEMEEPGIPVRLECPPCLEPDPPAVPALAILEETSELTPAQKARALFKKAQRLLLQERTSETIRSLEQALKLDGDSPASYDAWLLLGRLRLANPAWSTRAIEALQSASRTNAKAAEPWALMGKLYHRKGFRANAQGCFRKALELDPSVQVPDDFVQEDVDPRGSSPGSLMSRIKSILHHGE